jgi:hypothetical protein
MNYDYAYFNYCVATLVRLSLGLPFLKLNKLSL